MAKPTRTPSLISALLPEGIQAEEATIWHCTREAARLDNAAPGLSMRAVVAHATSVFSELRALGEARGQIPARSTLMGRMFSNLRAFGVDFMVTSEKSYRGTLLGIRHGIGVFLLLEDAAVATGDQRAADFCGVWLAERTRLVADVERDLAWFAGHPERALGRATPPIVAKIQRSVPLPAVLRERPPQAA